jgi:hypothetical protein
MNFRLKKGIDKNVIDIRTNLYDCEYNNKRFKEKYAQCLFSENIKISDVNLINPTSNTIALSEVVSNTKLIYKFYNSSCVQCVEDELDIVKQISDSIGVNNVIIISDYDNINRLSALIFRKKIQSSYFICREKFELPIEYDERAIPAFFLLDSDLRTKFVYKTGGDQNITDAYYNRVIKYFRNGY